MARTVKIEVLLDANGAVRGVKNIEGATISFTKTVDRSGDKVSRFGRIMDQALGINLANASQRLLGSIVNLVQGGINYLAASVGEAGIKAITERRLEQALINLGDASAASKQKIMDIASELQRFTNFGDDAIVTAGALLGSFKSVGSAEGIGLLLPRLADMAAGVAKVTGETVDLNQVATALGKALDGGAASLKRYGVSLSDAEVSALNAATGMEKVQMLADILDKNFQGLARATADPFKIMQNALGEVQEEIGGGMLPALRKMSELIADAAQDEDVLRLARSFGEELGGAILRVTEFLAENKDEIIETAEQLAEFATKVSNLITYLDNLGNSIVSSLGIEVETPPVNVVIRELNDDIDRAIRRLAFARDAILDFLNLGSGVAAVGVGRGFLPPPRNAGAPATGGGVGRGIMGPGSEAMGGGGGGGGGGGLDDDARKKAEREAAKRKKDLEDSERTLARLKIELMREGFAKEMAQIDFEFGERERLIREKYPEMADKLLAELRTARTRIEEEARVSLFGSGALVGEDLGKAEIDVGKQIADNAEAVTKRLREHIEARMQMEAEYNAIHAKGVEEKIKIDDKEAEATEERRIRYMASLGEQIGSDLMRAKSAREATDAVLEAIKQEIAAYVALAVAKAVAEQIGASLGTAAFVAPIVAAGIVAVMNAVVRASYEGSVPGFASGGLVRGKGGPRDDSILARVSNGEYIVNAQAASRNRAILAAINYGGVAQPVGGDMVGELKGLRKDIQSVEFRLQGVDQVGGFRRFEAREKRIGNG